MRHFAQPKSALHHCSNDPAEKFKIIKQIRDLIKQLEHTPCIPRPPVPPNVRFLEKKQPRFVEDPDSVPTITHVPLLEIRPTSEYKKMMKNKDQVQNVVYVDVPPAQSVHASPPWALPSGGTAAPAEPQLLPCPRRSCVCCPTAQKFFKSTQ
nr:uncharacterized protein LOC106677534 [Halyomorpha halys]